MALLWICSVVLLGLALVALSVRIIFKKNGQFSRRCAMSELEQETGVHSACGHCAVPADGQHEDCPRFQMHHGNVFTQTAEAIKKIAENEKK